MTGYTHAAQAVNPPVALHLSHVQPLSASQGNQDIKTNNRFNCELLTRKEAAKYLGLKPQTLAVWLCNKRHPLPVVRIGRLVKYKKADLDAFIQNHTSLS